MSLTATLALPYLAPGQAQKHVTVNESLRRLDALVQLSVVSATTSAEPGSPSDGEVYILPAGKSGAHWAGYADAALACFRDGAWEAITPREGWLAWVRDTDELLVFAGADWSRSAVRSGVGAAGLAANSFSDTQSVNAGLAVNFVTTRAGAPETSGSTLTTTGARLLAIEATALDVGQHGDGRFWIAARNPSSLGTTYGIDMLPTGGLLQRGGHFVFDGGQSPLPTSDNAINLGGASNRFATLYAATGTINTSDAREKTALTPLPPGLKRGVRAIMAEVGVFQWLTRLAAKGPEARLHIGVTAQAVRDALLAEGEEPARWGLFCADACDVGSASGDRLGLRVDQLLLLALAVLFEDQRGRSNIANS